LLPDPRRRQGIRSPLVSVVTVALMAMVCGCDDAEAMEIWGDANAEWLKCVGTYAPAIGRDEAVIARWRERNVFTIPDCQGSSVATVGGGGCGDVAADRKGAVTAPDCRPVQALLGLGARYYRLGD